MAEVNKYKCKYCGRTFKKEKSCVAHEKEHEMNDNPDPVYYVKFQVMTLVDNEPYVTMQVERAHTRMVDGKQILFEEGIEEEEMLETPGTWYDNDSWKPLTGNLHDHILERLVNSDYRWCGASVYKAVRDPLNTTAIQDAVAELEAALPTEAEIEEYRKYAVGYVKGEVEAYRKRAGSFVDCIRKEGLKWMDEAKNLFGSDAVMRCDIHKGKYGFGPSGRLAKSIEFSIRY